MKQHFSVIHLIILTIIFSAFSQEIETKKAPDFTLPDLNGKNVRFSSLLGKGPIVINFWATWCIPCHEELKKMKELYDKYHDQGVEFLAISIDDPKTVGRVKSFVQKYRYPFRILLDTNNEVIRLYQASVPPYTVLLKPDGTIVYSHLGYRRGDEKILEKEIQRVLAALEKETHSEGEKEKD